MFKTWFRIRGLFDGLELVLGSDFERSYSITCSKRGSKLRVDHDRAGWLKLVGAFIVARELWCTKI